MRYSDVELWEYPEDKLNELKTTLVFNDFCKWSIGRLTTLINESVHKQNWMEQEVKHLRNYRMKARDRFFTPKLVKGK